MNISRVGTPTPVNKPGVDKRIDDKMEILLEQQMALEEAIAYYNSKFAQADWWQEWYENARNTYQKKLDRLMFEIKNTSGFKNEPTEEQQAETTLATAGTGATADKKEATKSKDVKAS